MPATTDIKGLFVTGTDTGVGKTLFSAALARYLYEAGIDVGVMKPLESGVSDLALGGEDARLLAWATASNETLDQISPYRFLTPAAPATAARLEQRPVDYTGLVSSCREQIERHAFTIIEGAGGLMVPIAGGFLVADLVRDLGLDMLVVADAALGTINRTLTTLTTARYLELKVAGYVINRMPAEPSAAEKSAPHDLASLTIEELLAVIPELAGDSRTQIATLADMLPTLPSWPLLSSILPRH